MGMLIKSLKHSIWYASKILHGTRYAEQIKEVRRTPWGEGGIGQVGMTSLQVNCSLAEVNASVFIAVF